ncbi:MAG: DNA double-strand break repair nuclease NurA [Chloroflexi bacterium]|nr:DNA double-strand break repair nuclease NurA [Chloroflexota bacterium]
MPLKLGLIGPQVDDMAQTIARLSPEHDRFLTEAQDLLRGLNADALREKLRWQQNQQMRLPWLVAMPRGSLSGTVTSPAPPVDFSVVGCDASSIPPDRHSSVRCYVLNVGYAFLTYGRRPSAVLEAQSQLCFRDQDLYVFPDRRDVPIEGALLGARMEVETLRVLQGVMENGARPALILRDGPLILWTLQSESKEVQRALLRDLFGSMDRLREAGVPLAGYISYTNSRDLANSLRVWLCLTQPNKCEHCQSEKRDLCMALAKMHDRELLGFLTEGERSELFGSSSQILEEYGDHRVEFFYLNVGGEIVRVEVPQWVGSDATLLEFVHAAINDQCRRSPCFPPYPPALLEAHEQAVITTVERRLVEEIIDRAVGRQGQRLVRSAKDDSKRRRGV